MNSINQTQFEELWFSLDSTHWIVYFTAAWCGACKKLDLAKITEELQTKNIPFYICDETINNYTAGYCGIRKFPTFIYCNPKKIVSSVSNNNTSIIMEWIESINNTR